jgi:hypothetical protein
MVCVLVYECAKVNFSNNILSLNMNCFYMYATGFISRSLQFWVGYMLALFILLIFFLYVFISCFLNNLIHVLIILENKLNIIKYNFVQYRLKWIS